ncbi:hypothetical protein [Streptomyces glaucescens]|uniref:hypothetical protein n=1 Tax=Streptomyces glaucescens TaxID=1907 RepID=UPI000A3CAC93|nr:hypothetical protein [Streptomyces glaucescens]
MTRPWRDRLQKAANVLRADGHEEEALDVEAVLAPGAWNWLRETESKGELSPLPLTLDRRLKDALAKAAEDKGAVPSNVVVEGFRAFLDDDFVPPRVVAVRGSAHYSKTTMTVTVPKDLREQVSAKIPQVAEEAGYRITLSSIAIEWLLDQLGVERPAD